MSSDLTAPTAVIASDAVVEVLVPDHTGTEQWCEINGADSTEVVNGEVPINEVPTYRGSVTQPGELTKADITIGFSSFLPYMPVIREILKKYYAKQTLSLRWRNPGNVYVPLSSGAQNTISISTAGVVSFGSNVPAADLVAFATDQVPNGDALFTGTSPNQKNYIILDKTVGANGQLTSLQVVDSQTLAPPTSAVTDQAFGFKQVANSMPRIVCHIMNAGNLSGSVNQVGYSSGLSLKARHTMPFMVIDEN